MGVSSSSPAKTQEQLDLQWLGERFPYGDDELRHLYGAYQRLLVQKRESFLQDWGVECSSALQASTGKSQRSLQRIYQTPTSPEERRAVMQMVEEHILGSQQLGNTLFQVACMVPGDSSWYNTSQTNSEATTGAMGGGEEDEFTRKARLEHLMEGFSSMGRRGAKHSMTVLFNAVLEAANKDAPSTTAAPGEVDAPTISSATLMEWGYRLALATAFLQAVQELETQKPRKQQPLGGVVEKIDEKEEEEDTSQDLVAQASLLLKDFIPTDAHITQGLNPMAQSLTEKAKSRLNRYGILNQGQTSWNDDNPPSVELQDVLEWSEAVAPLFATILPTFLFHVLFWGRPFPPTRTPFEFPNHKPEDDEDGDEGDDKEDHHLESILDSKPRAFALACASSSLMGPYFRLYTSAADGLSFNRILNALLGYSGPTLILIQSTSRGEFGAFTSHAWKESKDFYGNSDCFLFQLHPHLAVYRPTMQSRNFMYCNSYARSKGYDQQAHGIGFGGTTDQPRLFLAENLMEDCQASPRDLTFDNGSLLPQPSSNGDSSFGGPPPSSHRHYFEIQSMEVWGVGGKDIVQAALDGRRKARELRDEGIRRARKVDKAQFLDDFRSGAIDSKAFAYKQQIDGRADADVDERNKGAYDYEK